MLGYKLRRNVRKACTGILRIFGDKNTSNFNPNFFTRDSHSEALVSNLRPFDTNYIYSRGLCKNVKHFPSICKCLRSLNKTPIRLQHTLPPNQNKVDGLPPLTSLPQEIFPGFVSPFSNFLLTHLVIRPYVDSSFNIKEFVLASKQVVQIVSGKLSNSDIDGISDMVTADIFQELKQNLPKFSVSQRQELAVDAEDIFFAVPAEMVLKNDADRDRKYLHICMIYHLSKDLKEAPPEDNFSPFNMQNIQQQFQPGQNPLIQIKEDMSKSYILNYRFTREYSSDSAGDWLLSGINHYRKSQIINLPF